MALEGFHPSVQRWFKSTLGAPTPPQAQAWPLIRDGKNVLIAAPTGSGKTLAAFLSALDGLLKQGNALPGETQVLYVSPLRALSNDIQKNLQKPLAELTREDVFLPEIRVQVRTGDTTAGDRAAMTRTPPHILVTTPESLYILLTSEGGRKMLRSVKTVIVDEIHALARDKRGAHLALSLERLEALCGPVQRIGLSATQKPMDEIACFLTGAGRECAVIDTGHLRRLDLGVEVPPSPLAAVCSHEVWGEIYARMTELIGQHRTTLIFVSTRKMAERLAARLSELVGENFVTCHHGSLSKEHRLDAEQRLKAGQLKALVATASLELGIDIGDVDLVLQVGSPRAIATFLQRVGRAGHGVGRTPKGRAFPLTIDELLESAALLRAIRKGELDRTTIPSGPLDILAQQAVAACVSGPWQEDELFETLRRAWPYRELSRDDFDAVLAMHAGSRAALLHRDRVQGRVLATRRARLTAVTCGGAIPDNADFRVLQEPEGTFVGTLNEDFSVESNVGDIFQLGNTSWRVTRVEPREGIMRVADAKGAPPSIPFWLGEAAARTRELSFEVGALREDCASTAWVERECGLTEFAARQVFEFLEEGRRVLGAVPSQKRVIAERFFDESGGMQMVLHAPFGGRINRAWGLALRKRFCRGFGFELQAAANEEAILISLGPMHSFPLESVFNFLHPDSAHEILVQALLDQPMFESRWRWNSARALVLERFSGGKRVPAFLMRMRANDLLAASFPQALACPETLPPGNLPVPMEHPLVRQTVNDCLTETLDGAGLIELLKAMRDGTIETRAVETPEPSAFARGILSAQPYTFLDDAPLEERRTQAVFMRRGMEPKQLDTLGALSPEAVTRVREEAFPAPRDAEELHEALTWMGFATEYEGRSISNWALWLDALAAQGRVALENGRWFAVEASREPKEMLRGRLDALGPVFAADAARWWGPETEPALAALLLELETEGAVLRCRLDGREAWCLRRLLARVHRYTIETLRKEIEPVSAADCLRFLARWQHAAEDQKLEGPQGVLMVVKQLAGFEVPAAAWERAILPLRVKGYRREWLDALTLSGELAWVRLWGAGACPIRVAPVCLLPRVDLERWLAFAPLEKNALTELSGYSKTVQSKLAEKGAMFTQDLERASGLLPEHFEHGLGELVAHGLATCDSFAGLRQLIVPPSKRRSPIVASGRWSLLTRAEAVENPGRRDETGLEFLARLLLRRTGVVFRKTLAREKLPATWGELLRVYKRLELRGEIRGGRFVAGFDGEQFALPDAVELMRVTRRQGPGPELNVSAADPLNFQGILTPGPRVANTVRAQVKVG